MNYINIAHTLRYIGQEQDRECHATRCQVESNTRIASVASSLVISSVETGRSLIEGCTIPIGEKICHNRSDSHDALLTTAVC